MIRPFTCICMLLAGGSGLYLYQSKHRAQMLDREIARTIKSTDAARERIGAMRAEWALLNEPERLAELSQQHLGLRQLDPKQFVTVADLGGRLPAPLPPGSFAMPAEEAVPVAALPPAAVPPVIGRLAALPAKPVTPQAPAPAPVPLAARPAPRPTPLAQPAPVSQPIQLASAAPLPAPRIVPSAPVLAVAVAPITATPRALPPGPGFAIGESVLRASALGGSRAALPPPTPYVAR